MNGLPNRVNDKQNEFNWAYNEWYIHLQMNNNMLPEFKEGLNWFERNKNKPWMDELREEYNINPVYKREIAAFYNALKLVGAINQWGQPLNNSKQIKSSPDYHDYDHEYQDIHEEDIDNWLNVPKQEYRVGNKVILKAEGDSATRTVTEILDTSCELKVGDSVNDFSSNKDYLDDVYNGNFVITSTKSKENNMRNNVIKSSKQIKSSYLVTTIDDEIDRRMYWNGSDGCWYYATSQGTKYDNYSDAENAVYEAALELPSDSKYPVGIKEINSSRRNNMRNNVIKSELNHFYKQATDYIYGDEISEDEWDDVARYQVEEDYYLTPQRARVDTFTVYSPQGEYLGQVSDTTKILDIVKKHLFSWKDWKELKDDIVLSGLDRNKDSLNGVFNSSRKSIKSSADLYDFTYEDEDEFDRHAFYAVEKDGYFEVTDTDPEYKEVRIGDIITADDAEDMGLEWTEAFVFSHKSIKSGYIIKVTETDNDHTYSPTYVNGDSWQSKEPQIFETKEDAQEQAEDFRKYLNGRRRSMGGRWQYKIEIIESSRKPIKSSNKTVIRQGPNLKTLDETPAEHIMKNLDAYKGYTRFDMEELVLNPSGYTLYDGDKRHIVYKKDGAEDITLLFRNDGELKDVKITSSRKPIKSGKKSVTRKQIEDELDRVLENKRISLNDDVYKETVDYIFSFWDDDFDDPRDVEEAVHEWYLDTKKNFPDVFKSGNRVASSRHFNWVKSAYLEYIHSSRKPIKSDLDFVNKGDKTIVKKNGRIVAFIGERPYGGFYYAFGKPSANHYMSFDVDDYETAVSRIKEFAEDKEGVFSSSCKPIKSSYKEDNMLSLRGFLMKSMLSDDEKRAFRKFIENRGFANDKWSFDSWEIIYYNWKNSKKGYTEEVEIESSCKPIKSLLKRN